MTIHNETAPNYHTTDIDAAAIAKEDKAIAKAIKILSNRLGRPGEAFTNPKSVKDYLCLKYAGQKSETFNILWLDNQNRLLKCETLFYGTIDSASVYPREVIKAALNVNAAACILSHNHPSGVIEPSAADKAITKKLQNSLLAIDVRILDHVIVGGCVNMATMSFAERGLI